MELERFHWIALVLVVGVSVLPLRSTGVTDQKDANALNALKLAWQSARLPWTGDPCEGPWIGLQCDETNTTVVSLTLPNQGLAGRLPPVIGNLTNLKMLDLAFNGNLNGPLPPEIGNLTKLEQLFLQYCNFSGSVPSEVGKLHALTYMSLRQNSFIGSLPSSIGQLSQISLFDVSNNNLSGGLPVSSTGGGLDTLTNAKHFHLQNNSFSGKIPSEIFNPDMSLIHLLLQNNLFSGSVSSKIGNLSHLNILRLDFNSLSGSIPLSIKELSNLTALQLNNNSLIGTLPELSDLNHLQILNLSYNQFKSAEIPSWLSSFSNISLIALEGGNLIGEIPADIFSLSSITNLMLGFNHLNGTLNLHNASLKLTEVDLEMNNISEANIGNYNGILKLQGNPVCNEPQNLPDDACSSSSQSLSPLPMPVSPSPSPSPSPSSLPSLSSTECTCNQKFEQNPTASACMCSYPIKGSVVFPALNLVTVSSIILDLQSGFAAGLNLSRPQIQLTTLTASQLMILIYPFNTVYWDHITTIQIYHALASQKIQFLSYGAYSFYPWCFYLLPENPSTILSTGAKIGIGTGAVVLVMAILAVGFYAVMQKRRADKAEQLNKPFASWMVGGGHIVDAPKLKGAQFFSFTDLKEATQNFSKNNEIGIGRYGKVYKGVLQSGAQVAIKRARASSIQGVTEFKNEIELLSRAHHKNLVGLLGFCFQEGEQMLVYEYIPNGTLRDCLSGQNGVLMDWQTRVQLALDSAKGLSYLHTAANPPIIHRDIKSGNILLDENFVAKVADFGLSVPAPDVDESDHNVSTQIKGNLGYVDPEYYPNLQLTEKSDVYSFGVVLLELITARKPIEHGRHIVHEVRTAFNKGAMPSLKPLLDPNLIDYPEGRMDSFLKLALRCVHGEGIYRPTMNEVVKELETLLHGNSNSHKVKVDIDYCSSILNTQGTDYSQSSIYSQFHYRGSSRIELNTIDPK